MLQLVDHRGNVVVVDGGVRLAGAVTIIPQHFVTGSEVDVVMIVGFEPVRLRVLVMEGCPAKPGSIAVVSLLEWIVGGRSFVPPQPASRGTPEPLRLALPRHDDDAGVAMQGRLQDVPVVEVVQLICGGKRDATIEIRDERCIPSLCGLLGVQNGRVVSAHTEDDGVGEAAFFSLLAPLRGKFRVRFQSESEPLQQPVQNIQRETTFLLLEYLRRLDEAARVPRVAQVAIESEVDGAAIVEIAPTVVPTRAAVVVEPVPATPALMVVPLAGLLGAPGRAAPSRARPAPAPTRATPSQKEPTTPRKRSPVRPALSTTASAAVVTGRFSRFFDEVASDPNASTPSVEPALPARAAEWEVPPPIGDIDDIVDAHRQFADDADLAISDALRFTSLQITLTNASSSREGPYERDTEIVDRNLISH
ncbi:MAG: DUF4388 domain-containing protein [Deltaproteobacteria bacterium]|nr:DUF4388 domain-containing protein [Deltaproteobacteria bacterium]